MRDICDKINNLINNQKNEQLNMYRITVDDVKKAVKNLKSGKFDGEEGLCSDHIRNASHHMIVFMCLVFNAMITHGVCPTSMMIGTMVPIPKIKSQIICKSDNFRAITLSSIMGKLLDWIILSKEKAALYTSNQQFGFKHGLSTTQCTNIRQETISYYNFHGSNVHVLLLDATN